MGRGIAPVPDWPYVVAIHNRLVFDSAGLARVVYHDATRGSLKIVRQQADGSFAAPETLVDDSKRVGLWPSVVLNSADGEHIVFTDWATRSVRYLNVATATNEVVHNGRREDSGTYEGVVFLGADARLWLHNDLPRVALQNSSDMHLSLAERDASGTWTLSPLEGTGRDTAFTGATASTSTTPMWTAKTSCSTWSSTLKSKAAPSSQTPRPHPPLSFTPLNKTPSPSQGRGESQAFLPLGWGEG